MQEATDFKDFSITSWYEDFEHVTLKSIILELSDEALKWCQHQEVPDDSEEEDSVEEETCLPQEFKDKLKNAFNTLGKIVFVKNNWHAPVVGKVTL